MRLKRRYKLFKVNSTDIHFDPVWFIPFGITAYALSYYSTFLLKMNFPSAKLIILGIIASFSFFFFGTLHELAHIVIGEKYGLSMKRITLFMGRMDSHMSGTPQNWWQEFSTALFGSLINFLLVFIFVHIKEMFIALGISLSPEFSLLLDYFILINIIIGIFNIMIPVLPLDGGRIMRSVLWGLSKNYIFATRFTLRFNNILGIMLAAFGIIMGEYFYVLGFVGVFILYQSRREQKKLHKYGET
ncbi:hypothetical protein MYX06_04060 [Patescibacteria group bacterium AH-259-L05]|nr:hypothetical protein [Patescibacteria group bacterium AH-259-L05]